MRSLPRPALYLSPAAVVLALFFCWPVLAGPPGAYEVVIVRPDGTVWPPLLPEGKSDLVGEYEIRQPNGSIAKVDVTGGVSLYSLLRAVGAQTGYETIVIRRSNGRTLTFTREEIEADLRPPGFFTNDATGKTMFVGYGVRAVEARDYFEINLSGQMRIHQIAGARSVDLRASRTEIDPGESVTFTATTKPKGTYRYDWALEPGVSKDDAGRKVTHRFDDEGRFEVVVRVYTSDDDRDSERGTVTIQVGDLKQSDEDRTGERDETTDSTPGNGTSTDSSGVTPSPTYEPPPPTPPPAPPDTSPSPDTGLSTGTPVTGNLLADASDPSPSNILESAARAARDGNPSQDADAGADVPEAAISIAGVLALLALGAGIENRQGYRLALRKPQLRFPRRAV